MTRSSIRTARTAKTLRELLAKEVETYNDLSAKYDAVFDPPEALENRLLVSKRRLDDLKLSLIQMEKRDSTTKLTNLRYLPLSSEYSFSVRDSKSNIIFEEESYEKDLDVPLIKYATVSKVVERLTFDEYSDPQGILEWLLVFRTFLTPNDFLDLLIDRFNIPYPKGTVSVKEQEYFTTRIAKPVRLRVLNMIKNWIDKYYEDFEENDSALLLKLRGFLSECEMDGELDALYKALDRGEKKAISDRNVTFLFSNVPPQPLSPRLSGDWDNRGDVLTWPPTEIARQMTLIESNLYRSISSQEFAELAYRPPATETNQKNISNFIERFNYVNQWVVTEITSCSSVHQRKETLIYMIEIADECLALNNFNGAMEIVSGLHSSAVHRLRHTWALVPDNIIEKFREQEELMSNNDNYKLLRQAVGYAERPLVPYLGIYLTDLTFILDAKKDMVEDAKDMINFSKIRHISRVIFLLQELQQVPYCLVEEKDLSEALVNLRQCSNDECYAASLLLEPRGSKPFTDRKVAFIVNHADKNVLRDWTKLSQNVQELFGINVSTLPFADFSSIDLIIETALDEGFNIIAAVGGEDVIHSVANAFLKSQGLKRKAVFSVVPIGGSDFARSMGLLLEPIDALSVIADGYTILCDSGRLKCRNEADPNVEITRWFVNVCSVGFGGKLVKRLASSRGSPGRKTPYRDKARLVLSGIQESLYYLKKPVNIFIDDVPPIRADLFELIICNGQYYGGGNCIAAEADMTDGILDIHLVETSSKLDIAKISSGMLIGRDISDISNFKTRRYEGKQITINNLEESIILVQADSNSIGCTPCTIEIVPGVLPLIVPKYRNVCRSETLGKKSSKFANANPKLDRSFSNLSFKEKNKQ